MTRVLSTAAWAAAILSQFSAFSQDNPLSLNRLDRRGPVGDEIAAPVHTWRAEFPGKALEILFVAPEYAWADGVALTRRFNLDVDAITPETWALGWSGAEARTNDYDLLLWGAPDTVPDLDAVPIHTVSVGYGGYAPYRPAPEADPVEAPVFWRGIPYDALRNAGFPPTEIDAGEWDGRRVAAIAFDAPPPSTQVLVPTQLDPRFAGPVYEEFAYAFIARVLLWATAYAPENLLLDIRDAGPTGPNEDEIPPQLPDEFVQTMRDSVFKTAMRPYELVFDSETHERYDLQVGLHYPHRDIERRIDLTDSTARNALTYPFQIPVGRGAYFLTVRILDRGRVVDWFTREYRVDEWPMLESFICDPLSVNPFDTVKLAFRVRAHSSNPRPATVYARAVDPLGRVVSEAYEIIPSDGGDAGIDLDLTDLIAPSIRVEAYAVDAPSGPIDPYAMERASFQFVDLPVRLRQRPPFAVIATGKGNADARARAVNARLLEGGVNTLTVPHDLPPAFGAGSTALRALPYLDAASDEVLLDSAASYGEFGAHAFLLSPSSPNDTPPNAEWRATAAGRVNPARPDAPEPEDAPGLDARFADAQAVAAYTEARDRVRSAVPAAMVGLQPPRTGADHRDWWYAFTHSDVLSIPPDAPGLLERARSYASPGAFGGVRFAPRGDEADQFRAWARWAPWHSALHQLGGAWLDAPSFARGADGPSIINAADALTEEATAYFTALPPLAEGLGAIAARGTWFNSGIAVFDNQQTRMREAALNPDSHEAGTRERAMLRSIARLGFQFDILSPELVSAGTLSNYSVLLFPGVAYVGEREAAAIAEFIANGGTVIADGPWEGLPESPPSATAALHARGLAVAMLHEAPPTADYDEATETRLAALLDEAGAVRACPAEADPMPFDGEWFRYGFDEAIVYAYLRDPRGARGHERVRFRGDDERHYYDMLQGLYLGDGPRVTERLAEGEALAVSALPYEVTELQLSAPEKVPAGTRLEFTVTLKTAPRLPGLHLVTVYLEPRYGGPVAHYTQTFEGERGAVTGMMPLARNEPMGWYTLRARDVLTGQQVEQYIEILPPYEP